MKRRVLLSLYGVLFRPWRFCLAANHRVIEFTGRSIMAIGAAALLCLFIPATILANGYSFTPLGDLPGGTFFSQAYEVSLDGLVVVGESRSASYSEAFRWTRGGGMVRLENVPAGGMSVAHGVSADGSVIVGQWKGNEAFRWASATGIMDLVDLPGIFFSDAEGVSGDGSVVAGGRQTDAGGEAFRWTSESGIIGLGYLPEHTVSFTNDISADGSVIVGGSVASSPSVTEAFRWTVAGGMIGLGDLPGGDFNSSAIGISANGTVVVGSSHSFSGYEAFRWTQADGMVGLGDLLGGAFRSAAVDVSADGSVIVGIGSPAAPDDAVFVWTLQDGMVNLRNRLIGAGSPD